MCTKLEKCYYMYCVPIIAPHSFGLSVPGPSAESEGRGGQADEAGPAESPESVQLC